MNEKKEGQAERLFEAMSGVDPELLARSEKKKNVISFQKYAKAMKVMAACLALIVVGGTCWVTLHNGGMQTMPMTEKMIFATDHDGNFAHNPNKGDMAEDAAGIVMPNHGKANDNEDNNAVGEMEKDRPNSWEEIDLNHTVSEDEEDHAIGDVETIQEETEAYQDAKGTEADYLAKISKSVILQEANPSYRGKVMLPGEAESSRQIEGKSLAVNVYYWLDGLELMPAEDQTFENYLSVQLFDEEGNAIKEIRVRDVYLQKSDLKGTFKIVDKEYDYDALRKALEAEPQAEE